MKEKTGKCGEKYSSTLFFAYAASYDLKKIREDGLAIDLNKEADDFIFTSSKLVQIYTK